MRLDASLGFEAPLNRVPEIARAAEAAGLDALWTAETSHDPFLLMEHHGWGSIADALANHARRGRWDALAGEVTDAMLEAFIVASDPAELRVALERHADGLIDRVAPYQAFGGPAWRRLLA